MSINSISGGGTVSLHIPETKVSHPHIDIQSLWGSLSLVMGETPYHEGEMTRLFLERFEGVEKKRVFESFLEDHKSLKGLNLVEEGLVSTLLEVHKEALKIFLGRQNVGGMVQCIIGMPGLEDTLSDDLKSETVCKNPVREAFRNLAASDIKQRMKIIEAICETLKSLLR